MVYKMHHAFFLYVLSLFQWIPHQESTSESVNVCTLEQILSYYEMVDVAFQNNLARRYIYTKD